MSIPREKGNLALNKRIVRSFYRSGSKRHSNNSMSGRTLNNTIKNSQPRLRLPGNKTLHK